MEKQKIYIVTQGVYSEYHICRVFLDEDKAEEYAKSINDSYTDDARVEVFEAGESNKPWRLGWYVERKIIDKGSNLPPEIQWFTKFLGEIPEVIDPEDDYEIKSARNNEFCLGSNNEWIFYMEAPNKETALKIASERYAKVQVEQDLTHRFKEWTTYKYSEV